MFIIIKKSWEDFFSLKMLTLNLLPILIGIVFWAFVLFYFSDYFIKFLEYFLPQSWQKISQNQGFFSHIGNILIHSLLYILLGFLILILTLIGNIFISIFYTPIVVKYLHKKYFYYIDIDSFGSIQTSIHHYIKSLGKFLLFFIVLTPFYFVPFIGFFAILIPHFFFFKNTMLFDIGSSIFNTVQYQSFMRKHKIKIYQISLMAYFFSLIPIFNFFATLLQTIIIARYLFQSKSNIN
ncbi:EI24 domain-containing protein [Helicobacter sp. 13S00477-4]|uniref:EI24 domain-containing protein n=1 Tax=Helicobacter sp. 13S00477-4 TaxID=1905759 RepID=UPI000BA6A541|nr:EI24 domain-containing protein [Helicobacter sp. 13S00477-4]PAF51529.1 peptidase [Helicobacter sp. 13S00477-4]